MDKPAQSASAAPPASPAASDTPFFPALQEEFDQGLVELARHRHEWNASLLSRDQERCEAICRDLMSGISRRLIAKRYGISRNSIHAIWEVLAERGGVEPLNKEIARRLNRCVTFSLENLEHALANNAIAAGSLPVATAILLDKKAQLDGLPTARIEHITTRRPSHEELNAWLERLPSANAQPGASDSGSAPEPLQLPAPEAPASEPEPPATKAATHEPS